MAENKGVRINKFLSEAGYCSRREADKLIEKKCILINDIIPEMGTKVHENDVVKVNGEVISKNNSKNTYIAFNKPVGIVCTTDTRFEKNNIIEYINYPKRIFPIGRLDKPSEGLILLTDDGDIVNKILRSRNHHEKEYLVEVNKEIDSNFIHKMSSGVPILDTVTKRCTVERISKNRFKIVLTQGLNRQIRRMCEHLGFKVLKLKRIRIMNIKLDMPVGKYRELSKKEFDMLEQLISHSSKEN